LGGGLPSQWSHGSKKLETQTEDEIAELEIATDFMPESSLPGSLSEDSENFWNQ
jgi:hypothetical protein